MYFIKSIFAQVIILAVAYITCLPQTMAQLLPIPEADGGVGQAQQPQPLAGQAYQYMLDTALVPLEGWNNIDEIFCVNCSNWNNRGHLTDCIAEHNRLFENSWRGQTDKAKVAWAVKQLRDKACKMLPTALEQFQLQCYEDQNGRRLFDSVVGPAVAAPAAPAYIPGAASASNGPLAGLSAAMLPAGDFRAVPSTVPTMASSLPGAWTPPCPPTPPPSRMERKVADLEAVVADLTRRITTLENMLTKH